MSSQPILALSISQARVTRVSHLTLHILKIPGASPFQSL